MDTARFDRVAKLLQQRRFSRRSVLAGGAGAAFAAGPPRVGPAATAQEATPTATPAITDDGELEFLFVQSFASGSLTPSTPTGATPAAGAGDYRLTLAQGLGHTLFFSDRPARVVGAVPTPRFLDALGFTPDAPPNAALVATTAGGDEEILVVELFDPAYDEATRTATYEVRILQEDERVDMTFRVEPRVDLAAADYGASHLFIDDCPDTVYCCETADGNPAGHLTVGTCWSWRKGDCLLCRDYSGACNDAFPSQCQGDCHLDSCG